MITPFESDDPWQDRLSEYVDGLLAAPEVTALEAHLPACDSCRRAIAELRAVVDRLRSDRVDDAPEDAWPRIANRLGAQAIQHDRGRWPSRYSGSIQSDTLRKIVAAAALTVTFVGGVWAGVALSVTQSVWTAPGWMAAIPRKLHIPSRSGPLPSYAADSIPTEWIPLQRSIVELDRQLASATVALGKSPGNEALQRVVQQLTRERNDLRAVLDSVTSRPNTNRDRARRPPAR